MLLNMQNLEYNVAMYVIIIMWSISIDFIRSSARNYKRKQGGIQVINFAFRRIIQNIKYNYFQVKINYSLLNISVPDIAFRNEMKILVIFRK